MDSQPSLLYRLSRATAWIFVAFALVALGAQEWWALVAALGLGGTLGGLARLARDQPQPGLGHTHAARLAAEQTVALERPVASIEDSDRDSMGMPTDPDPLAGFESSLEGEEEDEDEQTPTDRLFDVLVFGPDLTNPLPLVEECLAAGADAAATNEDGRTLLEFAALEHAPVSVLRRLAAAGARLEADSDVLAAVLTSDVDADTIAVLLDHGGSVNDPSDDYQSLVEQAIEVEADEDVVLALLARHPAPVPDVNDADWLELAVTRGLSVRVIDAILEAARQAGVALNHVAALIKALEEDHPAALAALLAAGADPFEIDADDRSALAWATETDDLAALKLFALASPPRRRLRLLGRAEGSADFTQPEDLESWIDVLDALEAQWAKGYGDPAQPAMFADGLAGESLNKALRTDTTLATAQGLLLAGANPFWSPDAKQPSTFEQACRRQDGTFLAMVLETESDAEAEFRLGTLPNPGTAWAETARAELALRRAMRARALGVAMRPSEASLAAGEPSA